MRRTSIPVVACLIVWVASTSIAGELFSDQSGEHELFKPEFTPTCNECLYRFRWENENSPDAFHEVHINLSVRDEGKGSYTVIERLTN